MNSPTIRPAKSGDEHAIARVHIQAWQEAYKGLFPQEYLDGLPSELEARIKMWARALSNPKKWTWVAEGPSDIVGFVMFGPPRDSNREGHIEIEAIYLLSSEKGKGIGFSLLSTGFNKMKDLGYKNAYCWVLEDNPTIKFYERSGATFLGQTKAGEIGGAHFKELAYEWHSLDVGSGPCELAAVDLTRTVPGDDSEMEVRATYKKLLAKIRAETDKVEVRREDSLPQDSKYQYRRILRNKCKRPHISAYRKDGSIYLSSDKHFEDFFSECIDYLGELICMAHEFGHHFSTDHEIDSLYDKIRDNGNCATPSEKQRVLAEENFAWDKAEEILKELNFSDWDAFCASKERGLRSYQGIYEWHPLSVVEAVQLLRPLRCRWYLAGGEALDTFLGRQTREHSDIDILVTREDQSEIQKLLEGWDLQVGDPPGTLRVWKSGEFLNPGIHDIWARPNVKSPWKVQFMLFDIENEEWVYRRNPAIRGSLRAMTLKSSDGFFYLAPEIQLLYKSKGLRPKDMQDFESVLPALSQAQRDWLKQALQSSYTNGHKWIPCL